MLIGNSEPERVRFWKRWSELIAVLSDHTQMYALNESFVIQRESEVTVRGQVWFRLAEVLSQREGD